MPDQGNILSETYRFINLSGTHYEVGRGLASRLKDHKRLRPYFVWDRFSPAGTAFGSFTELADFCESYCPGITEEARGLADGLGVSADELGFFNLYFVPRVPSCSQLAVLPPATEDGCIFVGRNYDLQPAEEDLCLLRTRAEGAFGHLGFSSEGLGRLDGMNSEGLVITMTGGGGFDYPPENKKAFLFTLALRAMLDSCSTTDEAVDMLLQMPVYWSTIFLIVDKGGNAALVEGLDSKYGVRYAGEGTADSIVFSTNHYNHPSMVPYNKHINEWLMANSQKRYKALSSFFGKNASHVTKEQVFSLLKTEMPAGLCARYYSEWFGTLWSEVFDVGHGRMDVCFGSPSRDPYHTFTLEEPAQDRDFAIELLDTKSS